MIFLPTQRLYMDSEMPRLPLLTQGCSHFHITASRHADVFIYELKTDLATPNSDPTELERMFKVS